MLWLSLFCHACILLLFFFFFQAEDGIRDTSVTGVQTCALPISPRNAFRPSSGRRSWERSAAPAPALRPPGDQHADARAERSEERRVGKEWRPRGAADH